MQKFSQTQPNLFQRLFDGAYLFLLASVSLFLITMCLMCLDGQRFTELMTSNGNMFIDFCKVYGLSRMVYAGQGANIYDAQAQRTFLQHLIPAHSFEAFVFLPYPPFVYALFGPFSTLPMVPAYGVWMVFTTLVGLTGLIYLRMQVGKKDTPAERLMLVALSLSSVFFFNTIFLGQTAWLITGLACIFFASLMRNDDTVCGIVLGLCTIKFQFLLLLGTPLLILKKWRVILIGGIIACLFILVATCSIGLRNVLNYPSILNVQEILHPNISMMINLRGFLFIVSPQTDHLNAVLSGVTAVFVIFTLWLSARSKAQRWKAISLSAIAYLIFSPHVFVYDGLLLSIPLAISLRRVSLTDALTEPNLYAKFSSILLCTFPVFGWAGYFGGNEILGRTLLCFNLLLFAAGLLDYYGNSYAACLTRSEV